MSRTAKALLLISLSWMAWLSVALYISYKRQLPQVDEIVSLPTSTQVDYPICGTVQPQQQPPQKEEIA